MRTRYLFLTLAIATMLITACGKGGRARHIDGQTPSAVEAGFQREFPGLMISHTDEVVMPDASIQYELKFRDAVNKYHRKRFSADGRLLDDRSNVILPANDVHTMPAPNLH